MWILGRDPCLKLPWLPVLGGHGEQPSLSILLNGGDLAADAQLDVVVDCVLHEGDGVLVRNHIACGIG